MRRILNVLCIHINYITNSAKVGNVQYLNDNTKVQKIQLEMT